MRRAHVLLALILGFAALASCHGKTPPPPPPAPPAPATPPPAPPPASREIAPQDEYSRIKTMDLDSINKMGLFEEIHFDFDKADIREGDRAILARDADALRKYDFLKVTIEGHCDERGTIEYNTALGDRRAKAGSDYLVSLGVSADRLKTVSYGKEAPLCQEHNEGCWARNRRAHFTVTGKTAGR